MNQSTTAAQPLDLDKLEALAKAATPGPWMRLFGERTIYDRMEDGCRGNAIVRADQAYSAKDAANLDFIAAANPATILALIAQARAARLDTTSSASIDTPEFRNLLNTWHRGKSGSSRPSKVSGDLAALIAYIDSRTALPVQAGEAVDERAGWEAAAKAISERAAGHFRNKNYTLQDECLQCASMLHDMKPARATLAPVAAQQAAAFMTKIGENDVYPFGIKPDGAAKAPAAQAVDAPTDEQIIAALHANGIDTYPSMYGFDAIQVSATSVPNLRKVLETLAATRGTK